MRSLGSFLTRLGLLAAAGCIGVGALPRAATADVTPPVCSDDEDVCEIGVEIPGGGGDGGSDPGTDGGVEPPAGGGSDTGTDALENCTSTVINGVDSHPLAGARPSDTAVLVIENCTIESGSTIQSAEWMELGADGQVQISPEVLAQRAVDRLVLLQPGIEASPGEVQLVQLPTWLWVSEATWSVRTAQAAAGGLIATATATPVAVSWAMGDGATVECDGRGTEWKRGTDPEAASDCSHTYTRPSSEELPVSATVTWQVTWVVTDAGGGEVASGTEPDMSTTGQTAWPVLESQALVER
ncbi:hypothetical protein [Glycomyces sp. NPDC047010]|uniref:hypothetical protein n=1 Tax=Glycomyces sp. NPDC047010 TaxID=3155023 RepID=UPI0033D324A4